MKYESLHSRIQFKVGSMKVEIISKNILLWMDGRLIKIYNLESLQESHHKLLRFTSFPNPVPYIHFSILMQIHQQPPFFSCNIFTLLAHNMSFGPFEIFTDNRSYKCSGKDIIRTLIDSSSLKPLDKNEYIQEHKIG